MPKEWFGKTLEGAVGVSGNQESSAPVLKPLAGPTAGGALTGRQLARSLVCDRARQL